MSTRSNSTVSDEEADRLFDYAVGLCEQWEASKRLMSGYEVYIDESDRLSIRPLELPANFSNGVRDLQELASTILLHHQSVRHYLGEYFGEEATLWQDSRIACMMQSIEKYLRKESYKLDDTIKGAPQNYNVLSLVFLFSEI